MQKKQKVSEGTPLKKGQAFFNLIGKVKLSDFTYQLDVLAKDSDWIYNTLNLGIDCGKGNVVYTSLMSGYGSERDNVVYVHGTKENEKKKIIDDYQNRFEIDWNDRFDEDILKTIGKDCFIEIGIERDSKGKIFKKRFLSGYDAIEYLERNLEDGVVVNVKGNIKYQVYNEEVQIKKEITSIFLSKFEEEKDFKAVFTQTVLLTSESIGGFDKDRDIYNIEAYVVDYVYKINKKKIKKNASFNINMELEVDKKNPKATKSFLNKILSVKDGKITEVTLEGILIEGADLVSITEDDIPTEILDLIEMGAYDMKDVISKLAIKGDRSKRMIIKRPKIKLIDDNPVIMIDKDKYVEGDLVFYYQLEADLEDSSNEKNSVTSKKTNKKEVYEDEFEEEEEEIEDWEAMLSEGD